MLSQPAHQEDTMNEHDNDARPPRFWFIMQFFFPGEYWSRVRYTGLLFVLGTALGLIGWLYVPTSSPEHYIDQAIGAMVAGLSFPRLVRLDREPF